MHWLLVILRFMHIGAGVFWAGSFFFIGRFLMPSIQAAGPAGGKVMQEIAARKLPQVMPIVALVTILSGLTLMWITSGGFAAVWTQSRMGITFMIGGGAALAAFLLGMMFVRPVMMQLPTLAQAAEKLAGAEREAKLAEYKALERRAATANSAVGGLLYLAVIAMAIARYV